MIDYRKYASYRSDYHPVRHRKKDLFSLNLKLSPEYRGKLMGIWSKDDLLGDFILSLNDYGELVSEAHAVNVHWSTKIEGNKLSLEEVLILCFLLFDFKLMVLNKHQAASTPFHQSQS